LSENNASKKVSRRRALKYMGGAVAVAAAAAIGYGAYQASQPPPTPTSTQTSTMMSTATSAVKTGPTLTFWVRDHSEALAKKYLPMFTDETGINVDYTTITFDESFQKYSTAFKGGAPPDVIDMAVDFSWPLYRMGAYLDITDLVKAHPTEVPLDDFWPTFMNSFYYTIEDKIYGLPYRCEGYASNWNMDMFKAKGFDQPYDTYDDLITNGPKFIDESKGIGGALLPYGDISVNQLQFIFDPIFRTYTGHPIIDDKYVPTIDNQDGKDALALCADLVSKYKIVPKSCMTAQYNNGAGNTMDLFDAGLGPWVASGGPNSAGYILTALPDATKWLAYSLTLAGPKTDSDTGKNRLAFMGGFGWHITSTTKYPEEAFQLLMFLMRPEINAEWTRGFPGRQSALTTPIGHERFDKYQDPQWSACMQSWVKYGYAYLYAGMGEVADPLTTAVNAIITGTQTVDQAHQYCVAEMNKRLKQGGYQS
jgi:ABC-type glycerol-3-phosphate transport system substrate-binding protein